MSKKLLLGMLLAVCATAGCCSKQPGSSGSGSGPANGQEDVVGMGRIEPVGGLIDVGAMMGDRLAALRVKESGQAKNEKAEADVKKDEVKKDDLLAELESRSLRALQLEAAELNLKKAKAMELGMAAHEQKIKLLERALAQTKKDEERIKGLTKDMVTDQERERQALVVQQAESELASAQAALLQLREANKLGLEAAQLELKTAKSQYERTLVTAPCDGTILKIYVRPGEAIGAKPILQMADLGRMAVIVEVYENQVKNIRLGQEAIVTSKAFPPPYDGDDQWLTGKVTRIGRMINVPLLKSVDPFAPADRHVVEVRVELDDESSRQSASLTNLQVDVRFPKSGK
jgi:HlyD family secretion protein